MENIVIDKKFNRAEGLEKLLKRDFTFFKKNDMIESKLTLDDFFILYDKLFYEIEKEGDINSHRYILNKTLDFMGLSLKDDDTIQELINEITRLKSELLVINQIKIN